MPLIGRKPFAREKPSKDLKPDEELFYCKLTHEVFREYEQFFDRVILCNSLIWTCSVTGRPGLTYQEALESEKSARNNLKKFPASLKRPVLFLATLTERGRLNDMCDDVFTFVKDRYFVGEQVEVSLNGSKKPCGVTRVIFPVEAKSPNPKHEGKQKKAKTVNPEKIKYEVEEKDEGKKMVVKSQCVSRTKGLYTKHQNKLFIKQNTSPKNGVWQVKDEAVAKNDLENFHFNDVYSGPLPKYASSPTKKKVSNSPEKNEKLNKKASSTDSAGKKTVQGRLNFKKESAEERVESQAAFERERFAAEKERQRLKEELRKRVEEDKVKSKERKLKEREQKKEEKRQIAEYLSMWRKPRDDLECDDLKDLPTPTPVECNIPQNCFGDAAMILEFLNTFGDLIRIKDSFPHGFTFDNLEKALLETDIQGCLNELIQLLLISIFQLQEGDDENSDADDNSNLTAFEEDSNLTAAKAMAVASAAASWPQLYHGTILRKMPLDSFSVTEILRLHIMASGADRGRGTFQGLNGISEDPGLWFKMEEPQLIKKLSSTSIFQLSCEERLKILTLLTNQLLLCTSLRNAVEDNSAKTRPLRMELKHLRWAYSRKLKEDAISKQKKKQDDKSKEVKNDVVNGDAEQLPVPIQSDEEKMDIDNLTPEEQQELEEKRMKEEARQKSEFLRKERETQEQIQKLQSSYNITPLGRDRAYRRFWVFQSIPGIFVEDDDNTVGTCLLKQTVQIPTPNAVPNRDDVSSGPMRKYLQQLGDNLNGSSDKENEILHDLAIIQSDLSIPLKNRKLSDLNPRVDCKRALSDGGIHDEQNCVQCREKISDIQGNLARYSTHSKNSSPVFGMCTACIDTCPVHNISEPRTKWSFFYKEEDVDELLSSLNPRGFREGPLREALIDEKERIKDFISKCQYSSLNRTLPPPPLPEVRKSQRHQNSHHSEYSEMKPEDALECTLRDMILEFENRIFAGGLGSIKVSNHGAWRTAIEQRSYDKQCDRLSWGSKYKTNNLRQNEKDSDIEENTHRSTSPVVVDQVIKDLASALLQVSQGIEAKYLHPPLGEDEDFKLQKQKALNDLAAWESRHKSKDPENEKESRSCPKIPKSPLERWQESLMECSSLSQLFVHLGTLERSVAWSRSVLKAHCRICRRRGDAENMLLCDGCNRGHHLYCLKPPLKEIPEGDWFCLSCKPPEKTLTPQKKQGEDVTEDEYTSDNDSDEKSDAEEETIDVDDSEEEEDEEEEDENDGVGYEVCESCGEAGTVICCDKCPLVFHPECVGLKRIPRGQWLCPKCTKKEDKKKKSQRHGVSGAYGTRSFSDNSHASPVLRTRIAIKGTKRQRKESSEEEAVPPKRSCREKKPETVNSTEKENPFKRVYRDTAINSVRRRSKSAGAGDMLDYKACIDLLIELIHHPSSWPFLVPVSKKDAPDYHLVIKRPMDFGTIRSKLNNMSYKNNDDFVRDIYLVLQNCEWFNPRSSPEYKAGRVLHKEVKRLLQDYQLSNALSINIKQTDVQS